MSLSSFFSARHPNCSYTIGARSLSRSNTVVSSSSLMLNVRTGTSRQSFCFPIYHPSVTVGLPLRSDSALLFRMTLIIICIYLVAVNSPLFHSEYVRILHSPFRFFLQCCTVSLMFKNLGIQSPISCGDIQNGVHYISSNAFNHTKHLYTTWRLFIMTE